ncbi:type VII secretion target [Actinoplanes sp. NPDC049548]|uniref:type VII secretion target n=1 Tax=Actinoplanes sp. NPDC049548 TaxID=3155152 RepID=UPI00344A26C2
MNSSDASEFQVDPAALRMHADEVDHIGDGLTLALQAGEAVQTDANAYGQLCQLVPVLLNALQDSMIDGMTTAAGSAHETAEALRAVADGYSAIDAGAAHRLRGIR